MKFSVDSNYLICTLQSWNPLHVATLADLEQRLDRGHLLHLIPHTLLETYSVMTRMPDPFRKPHSIVHHMMHENFGDFPVLPAPSTIWTILEDLAQRNLGGGQTYDRLIAFTAHQAGMKQLVTWNLKHFQSHGFPGLEIVRPGELS